MTQQDHAGARVWSRRDFVRTGAAAALVAPGSLLAARRGVQRGRGRIVPPAAHLGAETLGEYVDDARVNALVLRAVDAARAAGARFADARVTRTVRESDAGTTWSDEETVYLGVRVLVGGAWGFAASPYCDLEEAATLAHDAVAQAKINAAVFPREIDMGTYPVITGSWKTPILVDPFQISPEEKTDFVRSIDPTLLPRHVPRRHYNCGFEHVVLFRQERTVATTEGSLFSQTLYGTDAVFYVNVQAMDGGGNTIGFSQIHASGLTAGAGWEHLRDSGLRERIPQLIDEVEAEVLVPHKPVEIGRYELVASASTMARLVAATFSNATQLDRALGYEANASGTSYLGPDPTAHLGMALGAPMLTVRGDRSLSKGLATIQWDDEGVASEPFSIIENGVLVDYQTTREQASWLAPWYQQHHRPVRSHGCAVAPEAHRVPMQHTPNLVMQPGATSATFDDLVKNTTRGIALIDGDAGTDFQSRTGFAGGKMREIVNGKLGAFLDGAGMMFDSTQLWKGLTAIGGSASATLVTAVDWKGEPAQGSEYSIVAVPGHFKEATIVDVHHSA